MNYETLYKKDSKGKIRSYRLVVSRNTDGTATLFTFSGIHEGMVTKTTKDFKDTVNKTGYDKAITAANLKMTKKQESGYMKDLEECRTAEKPYPKKPILLSRYEKFKSNIKYPCLVSPKLDGVRATWRDGKLWTRGLKEHDAHCLKHIVRELRFPHFPNRLMLDGELYAHGFALQDIVHATRTYDIKITPHINFYVFDMPDHTERMESSTHTRQG